MINKEKSCGCVIVKEDKVLLISSKDDDGKVFYGFPKGHQEQNEDNIKTALRETKEEVGLDVRIIDKIPIKTGHFVHNGTAWKDIYFFLAKPVSSRIKRQEGEVEEVIWVTFGEAEEYLNKMGYYKDVWREAFARLKNIR